MTRLNPLLLVLVFLSASSTLANPHLANSRRHHAIIDRAGASLENITTTALEAATSTTTSQLVTSSSATIQSSSSSISLTSSSISLAQSSTTLSSAAVVTESSTSTASSASSTVSSTSSSTDPIETQPTTSSTSSTTASQPTTSATGTGTTLAPALVTTQSTKTYTSSKGASTTYIAKTTTAATTSGLSKGAIIGIVIAAVVVLVGIGFTLFRKLKLKPTRKFDTRKKPVDFSPANLPDPFFEKTSRRPNSIDSNSSADRARRQYVHELDAYEQQHDVYPLNDALVPGVPSHDFTAGPAASYPPYGVVPHQYDAYEQGYADLQRGPSDAAAAQPYPAYTVGGGGEYPQAYPDAHQHTQGQMYEDSSMPVGSEGLGRPTQGAGPYFAASHFAGGH